LNFTLKPEILLSNVSEINSAGDNYGSLGQNGQKVLVEYFANNVAKPPHIGHLRSAVIGDALKRLYKFLGYETVSDTHIGDWGVQFGILLYAFKQMGNKAQVEQDPISELNKLYVAMSDRIAQEPELREKGKQEFVKLEEGDEENRKLWEWFVSVSLVDFERYRQLLGLEAFDYNLGESFYEDKMPEILAELQEKQLVVTGEDGEQYVDLEAEGLGRCILIKSDGGTTYHLRDFATYKYRQQLGLWKNVYVVDARQQHHFKQLFKALELAGYPVLKDSVHVDFGFLALPEGAISTRKGNVISLEALINEADRRALAIIEEKNPGLNEKAVVAKKVALAAIKYFDLMHNRQSNIVFEWDKALSFDGNTGPYLQYAYVRVKGIERRLKIDNPKLTANDSGDAGFTEVAEKRLCSKLVYFKDVLDQAATEFYPHYICTYLFELASEFNNFYESVPVLKAETPEQKAVRLKLVQATAQVIKNGLGILGIEVLEEM
jgi:arginyl-tRNA synthetase